MDFSFRRIRDCRCIATLGPRDLNRPLLISIRILCGFRDAMQMPQGASLDIVS